MPDDGADLDCHSSGPIENIPRLRLPVYIAVVLTKS